MKLAGTQEDYLVSSTYIDWKNENIQKKAKQLRQKSENKIDYVKNALYMYLHDLPKEIQE